MRLNEVYRNSGLGKWFHGESATKEPGWDRYNSEGKRVGKCGDAKEGSAYSACLSKQKAQKLGKEGRSSFVKRKRAAQNQAGRGEKGTGKKGKKPINVDTGASKMEECVSCDHTLKNIAENVATNILKSVFNMSDEEIAMEKNKIAAQAPPGVLAAMAKADALTKQSLEHSAQNWRTAASGYRAATAATKQAKDVLVPQAQNLTYLKKGLAADTAATVGKIKSGEIKPGTPEWDSMEQRTANLTSGVTPSRAPYKNSSITPNMIANLPAKDIGPMREKLKQTEEMKAKLAADKLEAEQMIAPALDIIRRNFPTKKNNETQPVLQEIYTSKNTLLEGKNKPNDPEKWSACKSAAKSKFDVYPSAYANAWAAKCYKKKGGSWRSVKEGTQMDEFKSLIKENIVFNFLENAKPEFARRGAGRQRPKSWNKGTKSGSEKRKMREQGKRESDQREVYEGVSPFKRWELHQELKHEDTPNFERNMRQDAEIARMDQNAKWSMQRLLPVYKKHGMAEEHAARTDQYGFPVFAHAITHPNFKAFAKDFIDFHTIENKKHWAEHGKASSFHWPAILRAKQGLESLQQHEEYVAKKQQSSGDLTEGESWGPEFAGSSQDDATAKAYEDEAREAAMRQRGPVSHDEMMKKIQQAHEGALSHTYTAHTMGKHKKQDSHHMLSKYIEHFRHLMGPGSSD